MFVPSFSASKVTAFDPRTDRVLATIPTQAAAACCIYSSNDGKTLYVVAGASPYVTVVNTQTLKVTKVIKLVGTWGDRGSPVSRDGRIFWADTIPEATINGIDTRSLKVVKTFGGIGAQFEASRDGRYLMVVGNGTANPLGTSFFVRSAQTGQLLAEMPLPHGGGYMNRISPDGKTAYLVGNADINVPFTQVTRTWLDIVDISKPLKPRLIASHVTGADVQTAEFTSDGKQLWIPGMGDGTVVVLDVKSNKVVRRISTGLNLCGISFYENKAYMLIADIAVPPSYANDHSVGCNGANLMPGALTATGTGGQQGRPGQDTPGSMIVYDRKTYQLKNGEGIHLPGSAYFGLTVEVPNR